MDPIEVRSLFKSFTVKEGPVFRKTSKTVSALEGVSFEVKKGEIFGLLGPNGAGKTTTIKTICTLIQPSSGEVYVNGHDVVKDSQRARQDLGVMLTGDRTLYWKLTGRENLEYFAALYHMDRAEAKERIHSLLKLVGLEERQDTLVENYSTGMRMRLSFVKGILHNPPVVLLDEPTMSLDPQSARLIREIIQDLRRDGHAILLTTHYMEEADQLSDRVAVIDHGKIIALAPPRELKETVMKSEVIEIEAQNIDPQIVEKLKGIANISEVVSSIEDASSLRGLIKVHSTDGKNAIPDMLGVLVKGGVEVSNLKIATPTLEDVFISLTGRALRD
ncbi:ATP-binding cassette domain-containing protein [Candidatus Bathyarchaeota archaeon]|nr:MAG: ATP-binding cassette domain-containing protein [Candidatus Bathyarchaeota archaeon]TMI31305.1 MAG: ATP-binding cassette domain-containing protein [Candidatus Bathyarchaeota archaeon]